MKFTQIDIHLFGKPSWELDLEDFEITKKLSDELVTLGDSLQERLHESSFIINKLLDNGWSGSGALYDIMLWKQQNKKITLAELKVLEINPKSIEIREEDEDDEQQEQEQSNVSEKLDALKDQLREIKKFQKKYGKDALKLCEGLITIRQWKESEIKEEKQRLQKQKPKKVIKSR